MIKKTYPTILVLADIHYGDLSVSDQLGKSGPVEQKSIDYLVQKVSDALSKHHLTPDIIIAAGDLTSRGKAGEFTIAERILKSLANEVSIDSNKIIITYGNHDVDWRIAAIDESFIEDSKYNKLAAAKIGQLFCPSGDFAIDGPVHGSGIFHCENIDLLVLNSGIECFSDQDFPHGRLCSEQYNWLRYEVPSQFRADTFKIVVIHHHLMPLPFSNPTIDNSHLEQGADALKIFGRIGINMIVHGHRHHPIVKTVQESHWENPITFLCAGSFGVCPMERQNGKIPNTFHVIGDICKSDDQFFGKVYTLEQNSQDDWQFLKIGQDECDCDYEQWFGSTASIAQCRKIISKLIEECSVKDSQSRFIELPAYEDLEPDLRCMRLKNLNEEIERIAQSSDLETTGHYPTQNIILKRLNNGQE